MTEHTYQDLIVEAFIDPIRSVLIVDDDYPTLNEILLNPEEQKVFHDHKTWNKSQENRDKVRAVIEEFRRPGAPYLLDIHDGFYPSDDTDEDKVGTLQQTDLLILDYQLDKKKAGDGTKAVRMAREALTNKHFNLILVHTQEKLDRVFPEFIVGLLKPCFSIDSNLEVCAQLQSFLDLHEDALLASISDAQYVSAREFFKSNFEELLRCVHKRTPPWGDLKPLFASGNLHPSKWRDAIWHALETFEVENSDRFSQKDIEVLNWQETPEMFIRSRRGFVAFKSKETGQELMPKVREALFAWNPRPSRLVLTKLRAEMNERGIEVQDEALGETDVAAVWYWRLLEADDRNLNTIVDRTVRNHAEQLLDQLLPSVSEFAKKIRQVDSNTDPIEAAGTRFNLDLSDEKIKAHAKVGHNAFVGSKPVNSAHLELGHILQIGEDYWVCLTPACDMVPKRHRGKPYDRIEGVKRFTALKLLPRNTEEALAAATRGGQVFANIFDEKGKTTRRSFSVAPNLGASPTWMTMYVQADGFLSHSSGAVCHVSFVADPSSVEGPTTPIVKHAEARVCGMLRYEYALETQSKFITSQSRIGLDFEGEDIDTTEGGN
ncbi:response regulator receiver domain [Roseibium sp. FZY0029]|uniref:response regulator receiver domain n=1 Tax=Roseibium sp. FZY0029 TaxID=3116647 RepID=UPI002EAEEC7A|nr:response regulator receiver domain [Roseibium sp. FZY0029]